MLNRTEDSMATVEVLKRYLLAIAKTGAMRYVQKYVFEKKNRHFVQIVCLRKTKLCFHKSFNFTGEFVRYHVININANFPLENSIFTYRTAMRAQL